MTRAFIINLSVDSLDPFTLNDIAQDIFETLDRAGFSVDEVQPWAGHDQQAALPSITDPGNMTWPP